MSNYSAELTAAMVAKGSFTYAEALAFADEHGLKPRSVIAKIKSLQLPYEPKPARVTKRGEPVVLKAQYIVAIQEAVHAVIPSLAKMTKTDLATLCDAVGAEQPEPQVAE